MSFLVVLAALAFLMWVAYRGHSVILFAPIAALGAVLLTDPTLVEPMFLLGMQQGPDTLDQRRRQLAELPQERIGHDADWADANDCLDQLRHRAAELFDSHLNLNPGWAAKAALPQTLFRGQTAYEGVIGLANKLGVALVGEVLQLELQRARDDSHGVAVLDGVVGVM